MQKPPRRAAYPVLGGKDNFACDRDVGDRVAVTAPWAIVGARACRAYLRDSVLWLAGHGVDQFIDLGSGLPTTGNVHQIAQQVNPRCRVVYVDHDPVVLAYARALLERDPGVLVLDGDLRSPQAILADMRQHPEAIDLDRPVAVLLSAILHFMSDADRPEGILRTLREAVVPGSYLMISHVVADDDEIGSATRAAAAQYGAGAQPFTPRTTQQITELFEGLQMVRPGLRRLRHHGQPVTVLAGIGRTT
jgi:SAM-dependent methyltransferase